MSVPVSDQDCYLDHVAEHLLLLGPVICLGRSSTIEGLLSDNRTEKDSPAVVGPLAGHLVYFLPYVPLFD